MADYSLVPVDHQPDFDGVSLVPVEHDPFGADDVAQPTQPPPPSSGVSQANVSVPASQPSALEEGESWDPDNEHGDKAAPGASMAVAGNVPFKPFGELKPPNVTATERIGHWAADRAMALGMQPYTANDLTKRIGDVLGLTPPLGLAGSTLDFIDAADRRDLPGVLVAASGLIPGVRGVAKGVRSGRGLVRDAVHAAESPQILSEEIAEKTRSQIRDLAADKGLVPRGNALHPDYPRKWSDPVSGERRLRLDRAHIDPATGQPFDNPNAAVDHVHAYDVNGSPIEVNGDRHIPTVGE